jgi:RimJ/RimL family protein N-acetyltransferase
MADIRIATLADMGAMVNMGAVMHAESPRFSRYTFLPDRLSQSLQWVMDGHGRVWLAEQDGEVVGGFIAVVHQHYVCDLTHLSDLALYVYPQHRNGTTAVRLIKTFLAWAKEINAEPTISLNTDIAPERTARLMQALGAKQSGTNWTWGI